MLVGLFFVCCVCFAKDGQTSRATVEAKKTTDVLGSKLMARAQNWEEVSTVLGFWGSSLGQFKGKRRYVTKQTDGAGHLSDSARELLNDWQAWTPWVSQDIKAKISQEAAESVLEYAKALSTAAESGDSKPPYFGDAGRKYLLSLAAQSLDPSAQSWMDNPEAKVIGKGHEVPVKGLPGNPSFFPVSEEDFLDCLSFRMTPLKAFWDEVFEPSHEQNWREVWESIMYKWLAVCGLGNKNLGQMVTLGLQRYTGVGWEGRRSSEKPAFFSVKDVTGVRGYKLFTHALQSLNRRFEIHPIKISDFIGDDRPMSLRLTFWFCMLHRLNTYMEKVQLVRSASFDREKLWSVIQALLAQRLLAGEEKLLPAAEVFAFFDVNKEYSNGLLTRVGGMDGVEDSFLEKDRAFFALQDQHSRKKGPCGSVVSKEEIQGVLVEAALEEVMLACDAVFDAVSVTDESAGGCAHIRNAFNAIAKKLDPRKNSVEARLQHALCMLHFAFSNYGPSLMNKEGTLKCALAQDVDRMAWISVERETFLRDLKEQLARRCHCEYKEIEKRADAALIKLIPEILESFPDVDGSASSVRVVPMPAKKRVRRWRQGTIVKAKVKK